MTRLSSPQRLIIYPSSRQASQGWWAHGDPVGPPGTIQVLWLVERQGEQVRSRQVADVMFVPLTGQH